VVIIGTLIFVWTVYVAEDFGIDSTTAASKGAMVMLAMTFATLISFPVVGILLDRLGRLPVLIGALLTGGSGYCLLAMTGNPFSPLLYVFACMIGIGFAGAVTGANTLASDAAPKHMLGGIMGGLTSMQPIGVLIFLQAGGFLFDRVGYWAPFALRARPILRAVYGLRRSGNGWRSRKRVSNLRGAKKFNILKTTIDL